MSTWTNKQCATRIAMASWLIEPKSVLLSKVQRALRNWKSQKAYDGPSWQGVEDFHFHLAPITEQLTIEAAGWYKYPSSTRSDMDGKDWRLLIPDPEGGVVAINCHSLLHDDVWSLTTTIYRTSDVNLTNSYQVGSSNHWIRTLSWTKVVAEVLETDGYDYTKPKADLTKRLGLSRQASNIAGELLPRTLATVGVLSGLPNLHVGVSDVGLEGTGKIGMHRKPSWEHPYSILTVAPRAFSKGLDYVKIVIQHELIHYVLQGQDKDTHGDQFSEIAAKLGIPEKYRD